MNPQVRVVIEHALALLSRPGAWTQDAVARDRAGNAVPLCDPAAMAFCPVGAVLSAPVVREARWRALDAVNRSVPDLGGPLQPIARWNNQPGRTQAEVVAKLREVLADD